MKLARFVGDSLEAIRDFPFVARKRAGYQIQRLQDGEEPEDWKPMRVVGPGACEIRVRDDSGAYRVIYVAKFEEAVYVLHAFQKKSQATSKRDLDLAAKRYAEIVRSRSD
ncbi:MAG: type II toxin-antitoxin system RelE/ParE family toxin [Proteobacteria bacterium]|nr:type II toxin-antitoxin system RelE/ParE family toxin [Pseudomonadota bacterium]